MKWIQVTIDRPIGFIDDFGNRYPINYGYVKGVIAGYNEEQDAYVISNQVSTPIKNFTGVKIAVVKRADDVEEKWVISSPGEQFTRAQIAEKIAFIEKYFDTMIVFVEESK